MFKKDTGHAGESGNRCQSESYIWHEEANRTTRRSTNFNMPKVFSPKIVCLLVGGDTEAGGEGLPSLEKFFEKLFILWSAGTPPLTRNPLNPCLPPISV